MSEFGSEFKFDPGPFYSTAPVLPSVKDMFHITEGTFEEFKMEGYKAPSTAIDLSAEHKIPGDKNRDIFAEVTRKANDPGPTKYSEDFKMIEKRYWTPSNGRFRKSRRKTITDEAMETSQKLPGPGSYLTTPKGEPRKKTAAMGKFNKSEPESFLSNFEALAEEVPAASRYFQKAEDREKAYANLEKKVAVFKYVKEAPIKARHSEVGPGYLKDLEKNLNSKMLRKKTPDPAMVKEKRISYFHKRAMSARHVPGVGNYKDLDKAYTKHVVIKRSRTTKITEYKYTRCTEQAAKDKQWVPGPGSYDPVPFKKKRGSKS